MSKERFKEFLFVGEERVRCITSDLLDKVGEYDDFCDRAGSYEWGGDVEHYVDVCRLESDLIGGAVDEYERLSNKVKKELKVNGSEYQEKELKMLQQILEYSEEEDEKVISYVRKIITEYN